ncbi:hypothetical protein LINPERHAP2_LOCUS43596 [Linum perenne]
MNSFFGEPTLFRNFSFGLILIRHERRPPPPPSFARRIFGPSIRR